MTVFVGLDLGNTNHAVCVTNGAGQVLVEKLVANDIVTVTTVCAATAGIAHDDVHVGVESRHAAVVDALLGLGFRVFSINPKQVDRFRERGSVAGAKDDRRDARVLAQTLRTDGEHFRRVESPSACVVSLSSLNAEVDRLSEDVRRSANRVRDLVLRCWPFLLLQCPGADEAWFWAVLRAVLSDDVTPAGVERIMKSHRRRKRTAEVLAALSGHLEGSSAVKAATAPVLQRSLDQLEHLSTLLKASEVARDACLVSMKGTAEQPSDVDRLLSVPGVGMQTGAHLATTVVPLLKEADGLTRARALCGVAPVTKRSGKQCRTEMRRACSARLRLALFHAAASAAVWDESFHQLYSRQRAAGHNHARAVRAVGDKLLRVLDALLRHSALFQGTRRHPFKTAVVA
jgi:transposase